MFLDYSIKELGSSRAQARATLGKEFPSSTLSLVKRVPNSAIAHVSCAPSKIPYIGFSHSTASSMDSDVTFTQVTQVKSSPDIPCSLMAYTHPQAILRLPALITPLLAYANWNNVNLRITTQHPEALCSGKVMLSLPSLLIQPHPPVWIALSGFSRYIGIIQRVLVIQGLS